MPPAKGDAQPLHPILRIECLLWIAVKISLRDVRPLGVVIVGFLGVRRFPKQHLNY